MSKLGLPLLICVLFAACDAQAPMANVEVRAVPVKVLTSADSENAITLAAIQSAPGSKSDLERSADWAPAQVRSGKAWISCETDYAAHGDGTPLDSLEFFSMLDILSACKAQDIVRLRYSGKIDSDFSMLVERVSEMAERLEIGERILDLDSSGGHVEDAIIAGDQIAESHWTIWIREDALCHSACVLVLAAGDMRVIAGKVGIHRIIRLQSQATSRMELSRELDAVQTQMEVYLARNGAALALADMMMTIPNRKLRLLTADELATYGLDGINAAQDDLDRIRLARQCGEDFVRRRDAFNRAFDEQCAAPKQHVEVQNACGLTLRSRFGFPDRKCHAESPMAEYQ